MNTDLDTDASALGAVGVSAPPVLGQPLSRREHHVANEISPVHQGRTERLGTCPGLRAATVEVDTIGKRCHERRRAREL